MPVYEYKCKACGEKFDVFCSFRDDGKTVRCPKCGATDTEKVYSVFGTGSSASTCAPSPWRFG